MSVQFAPIVIALPKGNESPTQELTLEKLRESVKEHATATFGCTAKLSPDCHGERPARKMKNVDRSLTVSRVIKPVCYPCAEVIESERGITTYNLHGTLSSVLRGFEARVAEEANAVAQAAAKQAALDDFCSDIDLSKIEQSKQGKEERQERKRHGHSIGDTEAGQALDELRRRMPAGDHKPRSTKRQEFRQSVRDGSVTEE